MIGRLSQSCRETKRAIKKFVVDKLRSVTPVRLRLLSNGRSRGHLIDKANHAEAVFLRSSKQTTARGFLQDCYCVDGGWK